MGVASLPFDDLKTAKKFKTLMSKPWVCDVVYDEEYDIYSHEDNGYSLFFSSDDLGAYLDEVAEKKKKPFDIRKYMTEILKPHVEWLSYQLEVPYDLKALNTVRETLNLKKLTKGLKPNPSQKTLSSIIDLLKTNGYSIKHNELYIIKKNQKSINYSIRPVPKSLMGKSLNFSRILLKENKDPSKLLKKIDFIFKVNYEKQIKALEFFFENANKKQLDLIDPKIQSFKGKSIELKHKSGQSDKYWRAKVKGAELQTEFGRTGHKPRTNLKKFKSPTEAQKALMDLTAQKKKKGYVKV